MKTLDMFSVEGKVVVILGGKGVYGNAMVEGFAEGSAKVYIGARTIDTLENNAAALREKGYYVTAFKADQADEDSLFAFRDFVLEREGRIDAAVLNAVARPVSGFHCPKSEYEESMAVNGTGTFLAMRTFGDAIAENREGSIVMIGSMQGMIGPDYPMYEEAQMPGGMAADYFFHKGGMINLARFGGSYYGRFGVRCNCVSPGGCRSEHNTARFAEVYGKRTQLGRMATAEDLVGTVIFLVSDASKYITGANIPVDGGYTAK
ncbi:MAG: SDR family oxidoreductase [Clostridiales bacterium]|jgi:NAD(P)-dependent dehydrogenase (short-subunit alcohol dehydrogenase family)|nr:SDR family oxidoreductase [Clostridiales bacterium]